MTNVFKYYGLAILWALFIFTLCSIKIGSESNSPLFFSGFDKMVHCGLFFVQVVFTCAGAIKQQSASSIPYKPIIFITIAAIVYGGAIELLQRYVFTWRDGDWNDLFADSIGACMACFSILLTIKALKYVKK